MYQWQCNTCSHQYWTKLPDAEEPESFQTCLSCGAPHHFQVAINYERRREETE